MSGGWGRLVDASGCFPVLAHKHEAFKEKERARESPDLLLSEPWNSRGAMPHGDASPRPHHEFTFHTVPSYCIRADNRRAQA
jgi:hypothetical protein